MRCALVVVLVIASVILLATPFALEAYARDEPSAPHVIVAPGKDTFVILSQAEGARTTRMVRSDDFPFFEMEIVHKRTVTGQPGEQLRLGDATLRVPPADRLRVAFVGDTRLGPDAERVLTQIAAAAPDLIIHLGDISYSEGDERAWDEWVSLLTTKLPGIPIAYVTGNHDIETATDRAQISLFRGEEADYSFDAGPVHFVVLDSNHITDAQSAWLSKDLASAKRTGAWVVPLEHFPWYSSGSVHGGSEDARQADEAAFAANGVKLAFAGHEHNYERTKPIQGTTYIVTGGGGAPLYEDFGPTAPDWSAKREMRHEFVLVDFTRTSAVGEARGADGAVLDAFTIN